LILLLAFFRQIHPALVKPVVGPPSQQSFDALLELRRFLAQVLRNHTTNRYFGRNFARRIRHAAVGFHARCDVRMRADVALAVVSAKFGLKTG
jgi:hypothetical protein